MDRSKLQVKLRRVEKAINAFLAPYNLKIERCEIEIGESLEEGALASHRYPNRILVKREDVAESIVAHELVHVVQGTLEVFKGFRWLYSLLSEGLAEFIAKSLYPEHDVKYELHYELISILYGIDRNIVEEIVNINYLPLSPSDVDELLNSPHVSPYSKGIIKDQADHLRNNIRRAMNAKITDPTFISYGEDLRAWKFLINQKFDPKRREINEILEAYFETASVT